MSGCHDNVVVLPTPPPHPPPQLLTLLPLLSPISSSATHLPSPLRLRLHPHLTPPPPITAGSACRHVSSLRLSSRLPLRAVRAQSSALRPLPTAMSMRPFDLFNYGTDLEDGRQCADLQHRALQSCLHPNRLSPIDADNGWHATFQPLPAPPPEP